MTFAPVSVIFQRPTLSNILLEKVKSGAMRIPGDAVTHQIFIPVTASYLHPGASVTDSMIWFRHKNRKGDDRIRTSGHRS